MGTSTDIEPRVHPQSYLFSSIALDIASVIGCQRQNLASFGEWAAAGLERARLTRNALDLSMNMQELPDSQSNTLRIVEEACDTVLVSLEDRISEDVLDSAGGTPAPLDPNLNPSSADKVSISFPH